MAGDRNSSGAVDQNRYEEPETEEDVRLPPLSSPIDDAYDDWWGNISLGDQYDVRDTEGYWCEAEVGIFSCYISILNQNAYKAISSKLL